MGVEGFRQGESSVSLGRFYVQSSTVRRVSTLNFGSRKVARESTKETRHG